MLFNTKYVSVIYNMYITYLFYNVQDLAYLAGWLVDSSLAKLLIYLQFTQLFSYKAYIVLIIASSPWPVSFW